jgi:hypothetical protein
MKTNTSYALSILLGCNNYQRFTNSPSTTLSGLGATDVDLVKLYDSAYAVASWTHHSMTQLMQPFPDGLVPRQTQHSLQPKRTDTLLLARHVPHRPKPQTQWLAGVLKDRPGSGGNLVPTIPTMVKAPASKPASTMAASGTDKPIRPTQLNQVFPACLVSCKAALKIENSLRIVFHAWILHIVATGVKRIARIF